MDAGLAVPGDLDELASVVEAFKAERASDELLLTVAPTIACNLRCDYCFEVGHPNRYFGDEDMQALITLVRRELRSRRSLHVTWFGGEPLLHLDGIRRLSRAFLSAATFSGATYSASVITNGTLLTPAVAAELRRLRVMSAQIAVDGAQRDHDLLRVNARGQGSYKRVLDGITSAVPHLDVCVRVQVERRNAARVPALLEDLARRRLTGVALAFVRIEPPAVYRPEGTQDDPCAAVPRRFLAVPEFAALELEWTIRAAQLGFPPTPLSSEGALPCAAVHDSHLVVEPGSAVSRCWAHVGDEVARIGTLTPDGQLSRATDGDRDEHWRRYMPFDHGCADCTYLPMCMGGCPLARMSGGISTALNEDEALRFKESYVCTPRKQNLIPLLQARYSRPSEIAGASS